MRIALLTEDLAFGGINRYCLDLAKGLRAYPEIRCDLAALDSAGDDWLLQEARANGVAVQVLPMGSIRSLRDLLRENAIDILHSQGYRSNISSRIAVSTRRQETKVVCTVHGAYCFAVASWRSRLYYTADYLSMFSSHRVIAVSTATQRQVARWARGARPAMIHNGTAIPALPGKEERMACRRALGLSEQAKVVCFVGRLSPQKGIAALIDVAHTTTGIAPEVVFVIVGDGELRPEVESCSSSLGAQMLFVGSQHDVRPFYAAADALLLPSRSEGLPMTLIEAFAHGLPAVASDVGGIPEVLVDEHNGFLCKSSDSTLMSQRLLQLLHDDNLRTRLGANARKTVETDYSLSSMVEATYRIYQSLMCGS
jgi:glycosyltransferase involved in cell wall biosynthesis